MCRKEEFPISLQPPSPPSQTAAALRLKYSRRYFLRFHCRHSFAREREPSRLFGLLRISGASCFLQIILQSAASSQIKSQAFFRCCGAWRQKHPFCFSQPHKKTFAVHCSIGWLELCPHHDSDLKVLTQLANFWSTRKTRVTKRAFFMKFVRKQNYLAKINDEVSGPV